MLYNKHNKLTLHSVIEKYLPAAQAAGCFSQMQGLSGGSVYFKMGAQEYVARHELESPMPGVTLPRQYRALKHIAKGIGPRPVCMAEGWLIVEWLNGEVKSELPSLHTLTSLLYDLHRQPLFGWRISLLPLLEYYWQRAAPQRRTQSWLQWLKKLQRQGEPKPQHLAPLHMDVHVGNLVHQSNGIKLIDWEYAGDGDVALELAATALANHINSESLVHAYAQLSRIPQQTLSRQVTRWQPWVIMLMASWYECRWQQTQDRAFIALADEAWRLLREQK